MESKVYAAERDMLEKVLEQMRDSMKKSVHSASQSQENADSKVKETEIHLVSSQMALAKSQVENDVMKARIASQQDIFDTMQAKVASEVMSLEETVLKHNKEKGEISDEMNTITSKCAEEVRAAKEKLVVAELAIKELKLALEDKLAKSLQETDTKHNEEKDGLIKKMSALEADGVEEVMTAKRNQEVAESKVRALELEMGKALAKSQVEYNIMKARMASQQDMSDTMQAKVASEVMSLEETVLKDNEEKEEVSNEMNTITSKCAEEVRAAKEKLVVAELAIKELELAPEEVMAAKQNEEVAESKVRALELEM
jgi:predicted  nucleic acid-binding Zn-ribbon protein